VARWAAALPLGRIETPHLAALAALACVALAVRHRDRVRTGKPLQVGTAGSAGLAGGPGPAESNTSATTPGRRAGAVAAALAAIVVSAPALRPVLTAPGELAAVVPARGAELWRSGAVVLVLDDPDGASLLEGLRAEGVARVDVVVARRGSAPVASTVALLRSRFPVGAVLAPEGHRIRDAAVPAPGVWEVGGLRIGVRAIAPALDVEVEVRPTAP
jgi:hypothetical protein